jgi:biopolymer transport protein ExbD
MSLKLSRHKPQATKLELSMTSMIDVVFLLLTFFMVTSSFIQTERNLDPSIRVERPSPREVLSDLQPAIVDIVRDDAGFRYQLGMRRFDSVEDLLEVLRLFDNKRDGAFVRVADDVPFGMAAAAIQACKEAHFVPVSYLPISETPDTGSSRGEG